LMKISPPVFSSRKISARLVSCGDSGERRQTQ
jgi:hypothetical protein